MGTSCQMGLIHDRRGIPLFCLTVCFSLVSLHFSMAQSKIKNIPDSVRATEREGNLELYACVIVC